MNRHMQLARRFMHTINKRYARLSSVFLAVIVLWVDIITDTEIHFPLVYVLPVALAASRGQHYLAYALATTLPLLRIGFEFPWGTGASLAIAGINAVIEIAAMLLYAYLVDKAAARTKRLQKTATTREREVSQLRAFTRMASATLQGRGISPGMADGTALIYLPSESELTAAHERITLDEVQAEIDRLDTALAAAIRELDSTEKHLVGDMAVEERALLNVQLAILNDAEFWNICRRSVGANLIKVEQAVVEAVQEMVEVLAESHQDVMRERGADIRDIGRRILRNLGAASQPPANRLASLPPRTILVATELLPSDIFQLDHFNLLALVTERNSAASHVAILARNREIPAISNIENATALLTTGDHLLVDAETGTVTVAPTQIQSELFAGRLIRHATHVPAAVEKPEQGATTRDGVRIGLHANISRPDEAHLVSEYRLDGVGLFRSEFLFLDVAQPPTLDEQVATYSAVATALDPYPVVIRTMDFGGDKIPKFDRAESDFAFRSGRRGLALSLAENTMFRTQLQAIVRSAQVGDVRVMFPMVTGVADLSEAHRLVAEVIQTESLAKRVAIGAMIETPAAVIHIREIVKMVDFVSIGTNDLAHFILATDRQSQDSPGGLAFLHPSVLRATEHVVRTALNQGIGLSVCGEAAGNPTTVCLLVGMGVRSFSMNPFQAARIRQFLRQRTLEQMEATTREALHAATLTEVQQVAETAMRETEV